MAKTLAKMKSSQICRKTPQLSSPPYDGKRENKCTKKQVAPGRGLARNQTEAANYIVEMLAVLCNMAKDVDLKFLNYLLEMAFEEALNHASKTSEIVKNHSR